MFSRFLIHKLHLNVFARWKAVMPWNAYQHRSTFNRAWIRIYWNCSFLYCNIDACIGQDPMTACRIRNWWVQKNHRKHNADFQWPVITNSWKDIHLTQKTLINIQSCPKSKVKKWNYFQNNKFLHKLFKDIFSSMDCQLGKHDFSNPWQCITDRSAFNGVLFNDEPGHRNGSAG